MGGSVGSRTRARRAWSFRRSRPAGKPLQRRPVRTGDGPPDPRHRVHETAAPSDLDPRDPPAARGLPRRRRDRESSVTFWDLVAVGVFIVVAGVTASQFVLFAAASIELYRARLRDRHRLWRRVLGSPLAPRISVIVPAYNEELSINTTVRSLLALLYSNLEIVVVADGCTDRTIEVLVDEFELSPIHPSYQERVETKPVTAIYRSSFEPRL